MKSRSTIGIVGCMLLTLLPSTSIKAQAKGDIGTNRQQQTCPSRSEPRTGVISAAQAIKYATCEAEADRRVKSPGQTDFIDITSLQVNPKPRQAEYLDIRYFGNAIANSPVYEIKGTAVVYKCAAINNRAGGGRPGKNCLNTHPDDRGPNNSVGACFKEPSGNWRCRLSVGGGKGLQLGPPPVNASVSGSSETQSNPNLNSLKAKKCQDEIKYRSLSGEIPTNIQVINTRKFPIKVYWLTYQGTRQHYFDLEAGQKRDLKTFVSHPWLITDHQDSQTCLGIFFPTRMSGSIILD
jgi:VHL beta domain